MTNYMFTNEEFILVNIDFRTLKDKDKKAKQVKNYYNTHPGIFTNRVKFVKNLMSKGLAFRPAHGYYFIVDGSSIVGVGQSKRDKETGNLVAPKLKYLPPKKYNKTNLKYRDELLHGDIDEDNIPNVDDLHPYAKSDTSAELLSLSGNLQDIDKKRQKLKNLINSFEQEMKPLSEEYNVFGRIKTPVSIINKLQTRGFDITNPKSLVIKDAVGATVVVRSWNELEIVTKYIEKIFKGRILEKDDKYAQKLTTWCLESKKIGGKTIYQASDVIKDCEDCNPTCESETKEYKEPRYYTAIHYSILLNNLQDTDRKDDIFLIAELQVKTKTIKRLADMVHDLYKTREKKYNNLFHFLYDVAEQANVKSKEKNKLERAVLRFFYRMRVSKDEKKQEPEYYIPPKLIEIYYQNNKQLPENTLEMLERHERAVRGS